MAHIFTLPELLERSLRRIGAHSINSDGGPDAAYMQEAAYWLDLNLSQLGGTRRLLWLIPPAISITLAASTQAYNISQRNLSTEISQTLSTEFGDALTVNTTTPDGIQFPIEAVLRDSSGNDTPLTILRLWEWDAIADKDAAGTPNSIYIDRTVDPIMYVYPVPSTTGYSVRLTVQRFTADVTEYARQRANVIRQAWQRWAILAVAYDCGSGPIRKIPDQELALLAKDRDAARAELLGFENDEHFRHRRTVYNDLG